MATPTIESLCCLNSQNNNFTREIFVDFSAIPYNCVSILVSILGTIGALYQIFRSKHDLNRSHSTDLYRTRGKNIIKWLALADLMASQGIFVRSVIWLSHGSTIDASNVRDKLGEGFCIGISSWIHYFYTVTYIWTFVYALDVKLILRNIEVNQWIYRVLACTISAALCFGGLLSLYLPDVDCYSSLVNPVIRFLPNYLSTFLPIVFVMLINPVLYYASFLSIEQLVIIPKRRLSQANMKMVMNLKKKFFYINLVFYVCWIPNILNGIVMWASVSNRFILVLWYLMTILNPLQAVFNCFVYIIWDNGSAIARPKWLPPRLWFHEDFHLSTFTSSIDYSNSSSSNEGETHCDGNIFEMNHETERTHLL